MKLPQLTLRVISALAAAGILFACGYFGGSWGLIAISTLAISLGIVEYSRMAFSRFEVPKRFVFLYCLVCFALYAGILNWPESSFLFFALANAVFFSVALWLTRNLIPNEKLLPALAMGELGMICCVSLPIWAVKLTLLPKGPLWFMFLMLVVFAGDTFAYFGGRFFGNRKLMPHISPNKTVEGSIAGLLGSLVIGVLVVQLSFPEIPIFRTILFCIFCGMIAQSGDLLMSLVKRVAHVKDSGTIMPGHGGILDRLDGIFLAAPLVYAFAQASNTSI